LKQGSAENNMTENNEPISFGNYLKKLRHEKGIRLEEISAQTKVSMHVLSHIEKEDHAKLPSPSIVRAFLRLYADCLGADRNMLINLYTEHLENNTVSGPERGLLGKRLQFWFRFLLSFGIFASIVFFSVQYGSDTDVQEPASFPEPLKDVSENPEPGHETKNIEVLAVSPPPVEEEVSPQKHKLLIQAMDDTWVKLITDGKSPDEYVLASGDRLELEALTSFNILIGNAGGVKLTLDEKPVQISGKKGQVLTLKLP